MSRVLHTAAAAVTLLTAFSASADQRLTSLSQIETILGPAAQMETFQKFNPSPSTAYGLDFHTLDDNTVDFNRGPGLVNPGLSFTTSTGSSLQWSGVGAIGNSDDALTFELFGAGATAFVDLPQPTPAVGINLFGVSAVNVPPDYSLTVNVYGPDRTSVLDSENISINGNTPVFFGYDSPGGIGMVTFTAPTDPGRTISTDLLVYSVPEPASLAMVCIGLAVGMSRRGGRWSSRAAH